MLKLRTAFADSAWLNSMTLYIIYSTLSNLDVHMTHVRWTALEESWACVITAARNLMEGTVVQRPIVNVVYLSSDHILLHQTPAVITLMMPSTSTPAHRCPLYMIWSNCLLCSVCFCTNTCKFFAILGSATPQCYRYLLHYQHWTHLIIAPQMCHARTPTVLSLSLQSRKIIWR